MAKGPLKVLIADDNEDDREVVRRALRDLGRPVSCQEVSSVRGAMRCCENETFDCVIMDYSFPGEDGLNAIGQIHERFPHMPIVMVTGQGDEMIAREAMLRGAVDYLPKAKLSGTSVRRAVETAVEKAALRRQVAEQQEALTSFNRVLAHDLKVPLTAVHGFTKLLRRLVTEGDLKGAAALCTRIENATQRMGALIDVLHEYAKPEVMVLFETVNMTQVFEDTLANLDHLVNERKAKVTADPLPLVTGNIPMLINLLQNLIGNGIKFSVAEVPAVHVSAVPYGNNGWRFSVKDNGIGIPKEYYEPIFEPFTRLDKTGRFEGTGLGLATCKKIVERHQGAIWVESTPGEGTTMYFTLPGAKSQSSAA